MAKLKLQEDPRQMRFDCVSPALERSLSEEDGECTKAELEAGRDGEPMRHRTHGLDNMPQPPKAGTSDINADECSQVSPGKGHGGFRVIAHAGEDYTKTYS